MFLYYITDRRQLAGGEEKRRDRLLAKISEAVQSGVDFIQLREKDLSGRELEELAREAAKLVRGETRLLINSRTDVALAARAGGVHLRATDVSPRDVRAIWRACSGDREAIVAASCHTEDEVREAEIAGADFAVFGPVFEKREAPEAQRAGTESLQLACRHKIPVLALGGITEENARVCLQAGAAGIAGIRLFQENDLKTVVPRLRALSVYDER